MKICPMCGASYDDASVFCSVDGAALRSLADGNDLIHTVIADRYLITRKLGEGGMGRVYLAKHVRLPQSWAIKILAPALLRDAGALTRFNQEAASASQIENRHVARVIDFGETSDGLLYLAMEYVDGEPLSKLIEREGPLDPERAADITAQVAEALTAAHELGIVHRDLKPDNIMVGRGRGGADDVKVVDFGIAKAIHQGEGEKVTKTGFAIGTPEYMSPEQLSAGEVDGRSDLYSLALVTFRMLTGTLPFPADTPQESMFMRVTHAPRALADMHPDVEWSPGLQGVMDRALARDPDDRFQSVADFARALREAVTGQHSAAMATRENDSLATGTSAVDATGTGAAPATIEGRQSAPAPTTSPIGTPAPAPAPRQQGGAPPSETPHRRAPARTGGLMAVGVAALVGLGGYFLVGQRHGGDSSGEAPVTPAGIATSDTSGAVAERTVSSLPSAPGAGATTTSDEARDAGASAPQPAPPQARPTSEPAAGTERGRSDHTRRDSGAVPDSRAGASPPPSRPPARDDAGAHVAPASESSSLTARRELDNLQNLIEGLSESNARRVLATLPDALPRLATRADTVEAWFYALQADVLLSDFSSACDLVKRMGPDAKTAPFAATLQILSDTLHCR